MNKNILKSNNLKTTKNRELILSIFKNNKLPLCAEDIYTKLNNNINIATIYRNLNLLNKKGILIKIAFEDGKMYYKLNNHTHKLVCNICHNVTTINNCPMELISKNISNDTGFLITSHYLEVEGICPNCSKQT
jgi:Fur family ferric uptake transcriptional regulator